MLKITLPILAILFVVAMLPMARVMAEQTNCNKQSDDFKKAGINLEDMQKRLKMTKEGFKQNHQTFKEEYKADKASEEGRQNEADRLGNIDADSLEGRGRAEHAKNKYVKNIFVDYNKPGFSRYRQDAMDHKAGAAKVMNKLEAELSEMGINCKEDEGYLEPEQEYYLSKQTREFTNEQQFGADASNRSHQGDVKYNKVICEQPKNSYSCMNQSSVRCKRKGMKWNRYEKHGFGLYLGKQRRDLNWHQAKKQVADRLGVSIDNIEPVYNSVRYRQRTDWGVNGKEDYYVQVHHVTGDVIYKDGGEEVCEEWETKWRETCSIK